MASSQKQQRKSILSQYRLKGDTSPWLKYCHNKQAFDSITPVARGTARFAETDCSQLTVSKAFPAEMAMAAVKKIDLQKLTDCLQQDLAATVTTSADNNSAVLTLEDGSEVALCTKPVVRWRLKGLDDQFRPVFNCDKKLGSGEVLLCSFKLCNTEPISWLTRIYALAWTMLRALAMQQKVGFMRVFENTSPEAICIESCLKCDSLEELLHLWCFDITGEWRGERSWTECLAYAGLPELEIDGTTSYADVGDSYDDDDEGVDADEKRRRQLEVMLHCIFTGSLKPQDGEVYAVEDGKELRLTPADSDRTLGGKVLKAQQLRSLDSLIGMKN